MNPTTVALLRRMFRYLNRFMLLMWRLGLNWWFTLAPRYTGNIMVLHQTGRKSGLQRHTPLNYALVNNELYCTSGFGEVSHWYQNILANPSVEVWLPDGRWMGTAEDITEHANSLDLLRQVLIGSGFAAFAAGINPYTITDSDLATVAKDYRVIHIRRAETVTSSKRPDDLHWVWQVATFVMLGLVLIRRRGGKNVAER